MHSIYFYRDKQGKQPVVEYLDSLAAKSDKDSRIKLKKIQDYMHILNNMANWQANHTSSTLTAIYGSFAPCVIGFSLLAGITTASFFYMFL